MKSPQGDEQDVVLGCPLLSPAITYLPQATVDFQATTKILGAGIKLKAANLTMPPLHIQASLSATKSLGHHLNVIAASHEQRVTFLLRDQAL